jgi:hypothetical protein
MLSSFDFAGALSSFVGDARPLVSRLVVVVSVLLGEILPVDVSRLAGEVLPVCVLSLVGETRPLSPFVLLRSLVGDARPLLLSPTVDDVLVLSLFAPI